MRVALIGLTVLLTGCSNPALKACDTAIKKTLRAPSTYKRVSSTGYSVDAVTTISIEYDADNSFGVPLRGKGLCTVRQGQGEWLELT